MLPDLFVQHSNYVRFRTETRVINAQTKQLMCGLLLTCKNNSCETSTHIHVSPFIMMEARTKSFLTRKTHFIAYKISTAQKPPPPPI